MRVTAEVKTRRLVVTCLGSSTTAGRGEAFDWIGALEKRPQNSVFSFRNLGVGGDLAHNCLLRLPSVLATDPDRVVVIVGSNDILATVFPSVRRIDPSGPASTQRSLRRVQRRHPRRRS